MHSRTWTRPSHRPVTSNKSQSTAYNENIWLTCPTPFLYLKQQERALGNEANSHVGYSSEKCNAGAWAFFRRWRGAVVLRFSSTLRTALAAKQLKPSALFQTQGCNLLMQYTWQSSLVEYEPAFATTAHTPFLARLQLTGLYLFIYLFIIFTLRTFNQINWSFCCR